MRAIIVAAAVLLAQSSFAMEEFGLEILMDSKKPDAPPPVISKLVRKQEKKELDYCQKDKHYTKKEMEGFFGAVVLNLNDDSKNDYLIYPKKYCFNMFGAHAIPYWIVLSSPTGYRIVKSGSTDAVKILETKTNNTKDFVGIYGRDETKYIFDEKKYQRADGLED